MIHFDPSDIERMDKTWTKLAEQGTVMMPLDKYSFSEHYGWVADSYGVSWQLLMHPAGTERPTVVPSLMYTGAMAGKAAQAIDFYCAVFTDGKPGIKAPRPQDVGAGKAGTLMYGDFYIDGTWLAAMDSANTHNFVFNDGVSLLIYCETQEEIDHYWSALTKGGQPGQCGWLKDQFGVSWQVASTVMFNALKNGSREQINRVVQAFMPMAKIDIATLQKAYDGN